MTISQVRDVSTPKAKVMIADVPLHVLIDTGASINVIDETAYQTILKSRQNKRISLRNPATKIYSYGGSKPLPVLGMFVTHVESKRKLTPATIYVIRGAHGCLLSYKTATELDLISINTSSIASVNNPTPAASNHNSNDITKQYPDLFTGIGKMKDFQDAIQQILSDIDGVRNVSDDIIIFGRDQQAHDRALQAVFTRLRAKNLTLNPRKYEFNKSSIEFFGYKKVAAINNAKPPTNAHEVRSFLGMTNYCSRFILNYSTITAPLRNFTKSDQPWTWTSSEQQAFDQLKRLHTSDTILSYFDPHQTTTILVDASPVGLGAILCQHNRVVAYASRSLSPVEQRYSQTEREALAVLFACEHFHLYIYGAQFSIITDHKPLERIFANPGARSNARLERWALKLQPYDFTITYSPGKTNPADYLSRHLLTTTGPSTASDHAEEYIAFLAHHTTPKAITTSEVKQHTRQDSTLQAVMTALRNNSWSSVLTSPDPSTNSNDLQAFYKIRDELSVSDSQDLLLRSHRLVLPVTLRSRVLQIAHEGHQGLTKTKQLLREKIWFPGIDAMTKQLLDNCIACQANVLQHSFAPLQMTPLPQAPWQYLSADFCGPLPSGDMLFVVIDEYSRYPEVEIVRSTSANTVIPKLDRILYQLFNIRKCDNLLYSIFGVTEFF